MSSEEFKNKEILLEIMKEEFSVFQSILLRDGRLPLIFRLYGRDNQVHHIQFEEVSDESKPKISELIRLACVANDIWGLTSGFEAWMAEPGGRPSLNPDRKEAFVHVGSWVERDGSILTYLLPYLIERNADGDIIDLQEADRPPEPTQESKGHLAHLLPTERPTLKERRDARQAFNKLMKRATRGHESGVVPRKKLH
ncbi:hypothetical protein ACFOY8_15165 [Thalassospira xianhensis]|uniref:Uncharacterized protein n=1 Tax=Thalassospira xianhensis MCCC 1A02616 TaxID=1177929 RepID=A0A367UH81_9PROT|nr:hypothetical protein [Thalassospira xianhensis]RCK07519.1 hypothetical protein TH5_00055 [Thalassospira xianhensis MCCC 1A02616]